MSKYTEILEKVQGYLQNNNNPELKEGEITLYDLYNIVDEATKELYKKKEADELLQKVNKENSIVKKVGRLFKKKEICDRFGSISLNMDEKDVHMCFYSGMYNWYDVYLDSETGELYSKCPNNVYLEIIDKHYGEIRDILVSLEEFRSLTGMTRSSLSNDDGTVKQEIDDGFINATLRLTSYGWLKLDICVSKKFDPDGVSKRNYYEKDVIQDVIDKNDMTIAKNILVDENKLASGYKKILNRRKNKKEDDK